MSRSRLAAHVGRAYAAFRGSTAFLWLLFAVVAGWIGWNLIPGLPHWDDPEFGRLNLFLSVEASVTVSLLLAWSDRQAAAQRKLDERLLHLMEAVYALLLARRGEAAGDAGGGVGSAEPPAQE